jgi:RNA polymerase sigma-32 factor
MAHIDDAETRRANLDFVRAAMRTPLLSREYELDLARRWRENGDESALQELVRAYTRLAVSVAGTYRRYGLPIGDLIQEGNIGLLEAAMRFEPERNLRFSTYAMWWIRSAVQDYILRNWSIVRTGTTSAQKALFFNLRRLQNQIAEASDGPMTDEARRQIAEALHVAIGDVENMETRLSGGDRSLNAPLGPDSEAEAQDLLPDSQANPETVVIGMRDAEARSRWLAEALGELSPREQRIIRERRLAEQGITLEALGREFGVSKERVRQLEHRALRKLKSAIGRRAGNPSDMFIC